MQSGVFVTANLSLDDDVRRVVFCFAVVRVFSDPSDLHGTSVGKGQASELIFEVTMLILMRIIRVEPMVGIEPTTYGLRNHFSEDGAFMMLAAKTPVSSMFTR